MAAETGSGRMAETGSGRMDGFTFFQCPASSCGSS